MRKLIIFILSMLLLGSICNGQGVTTFGANSANNFSKTLGKLWVTTLGSGGDTSVLWVNDSGVVRRIPIATFRSIIQIPYSAGWALDLTGTTFRVDSNVLDNVFVKNYDPTKSVEIGVLTTGALIVNPGIAQLNGGINAPNISDIEGNIVTQNTGTGEIGVSAISTNDLATLDTLQQFLPVTSVLSTGAIANDTGDDVRGIEDAILERSGFRFVGANVARGIDTIRQFRDSMNGGIVFIPLGQYYAKRHLVDTVVHIFLNGDTILRQANYQIYVPYMPIQDSTKGNPFSIEILGQSPPLVSFTSPSRVLRRPDWSNGNNIQSTIANDGSTYPAILGCVKGDLVLGATAPSMLYVRATNLWLSSRFDSSLGGTQLSGIDFQYALDAEIDYCRADIDTDVVKSFKPTHDVYGFRLTNSGQGTLNGIRNSLATGFTFGAVYAEHAIVDNFQSMVNWSGQEIMPSFHSVSERDMNVHWCKYGITTGYISSPFAGAGIKIYGTFRNERLQGTTFWTNSEYDIKDSLSALSGNIVYETRNFGSGSMPQGGIVVQGTTAVSLKPIDSLIWRYGSTVTLAVKPNGNVGIGKIPGSANLDVTGTNLIAGNFTTTTNGSAEVRVSSAASTFNSAFTLSEGGAVRWNMLNLGSTDEFGIYSGAGTKGFAISQGALTITTGNSAFLQTTSDNRYGLNDVTPDFTLDVESPNTDIASFEQTGSQNSTVRLKSASNFNMLLKYMNNNANVWYVGNVGTSGANRYSWTNSDANGDVEVMTLLQNGQLGLGNTTPDASAKLDVVSTTGGILFPRMTATQASAITGVNGLMIYVTSTNGTFTAIGFWGYEAGAWVKK